MIDIKQITDYLSEHISDPVPKYILVKEIYKKDPSSLEYSNAYNEMKQSKWYRELADEQWDDGSWGRFHTMNSKDKKQKFGSTEIALRRARGLGFSKDDPMIAKCIKIMERYVREEETWTDKVEKHKDNGKSHLFCRPYLTAANINLFDPDNPLIKPLRDNVAGAIKKAFESGVFDEKFWKQKVTEYHVPNIAHPGIAYSAMLLQNSNCMEDVLQRQYLYYIWNRTNGVYYVSELPPCEKQYLEDKSFNEWLGIIELLSGFSLFSDFMKDDILPHLFNEINRIIHEDITCNLNCRYADNYRDKNKRKSDIILRITRTLVKC